MPSTLRADECFNCRLYRAIDLGPIGDPADLDVPFLGGSTFGINSLGEVVWYRTVSLSPGTAIRAFVWLPVANASYGLAAGTYELTIPCSFASNVPVTAACDINDAGYIAGSARHSITPVRDQDQRAVVWRMDLASAGSPATIPGTCVDPQEIELPGGTEDAGCWTHAHAVNNDSPPEVVGTASIRICDHPACDSLDPLVGFRLAFGSTSTPTGLPPSADSANSMAFAISDESTATIVGRDQFGANTVCQSDFNPTTCVDVNNPADALAWAASGGSPTELVEIGYSTGDRGITIARDIDVAGHIVGLSETQVEMVGCVPLASFWEGSSATAAFDLISVCGEAVQSRAEAIVQVDEDLLYACGSSSTDALLWHRVDEAWCCNALRYITFRPTGDASGDADLAIAHDISADGFIVCHGVDQDTQFHVYVLTCAADLSGDFRVDSTDLGLLLAAYSLTNRSEDLNEDGEVESADLGLLLGAYSDEGQVCTVQCLVEEQPEFSGGGSAEEVLAAVQALGFQSVADFVAWGLEVDAGKLDAAAQTIRSLLASGM